MHRNVSPAIIPLGRPRHLLVALLWPLLGLLFVANTVNIAADFGAMALCIAGMAASMFTRGP